VNPIRWQIDDDAFVRTLVPDDAEAVFAVIDANRAHIRPWMPWEPLEREPADVRAFIQRSIASETDLEGNGIWVGERFAGGIGLSIDPLNASGEIGYWVASSFEGRGLVTRACRLFLGHGFRELGLHRISIHAATQNTRSRAVAERLGLQQEAVLRQAGRTGDGTFVDLVVYAMLEHEWSRS
jgi:ribosomal-protein-serine acetyltransferase